MDTNKNELNPNDMEQAAGGTCLVDNRFSDAEYANADIRIVPHWIARDEFWWRGKNIQHTGANAVVAFHKAFGRQPSSLKEAIEFDDKNTPEDGSYSCSLSNLT